MTMTTDKANKIRSRLFDLRTTYAPTVQDSPMAKAIRELCGLVEDLLPVPKTQHVIRYIVTYTNKAVPEQDEPPYVMMRGTFNTQAEAEVEADSIRLHGAMLCVNVVAIKCEVPLYD